MKLQIADRKLQIGRAVALSLACVLMLAVPARMAFAGEVIERVLAVAAGDVITLADVTAARTFGLVPTPPSPDPIGETLARLIDRSLMLAEVDRYAPPEPNPTAINVEFAAVRARFSTEAAFDGALAKVGMDEKYLRETLRQNLRIREYIEQRFTVPPPGDDELTAYYRSHLAAFSETGQPAAFADVRSRLVDAVIAEHREALVNTWLAGLRRRAEVTNLYLTSK